MATKKDKDEGEARTGQLASMPGSFPCPDCGEPILHGSKVGVEVACTNCGNRHPVPEGS
jgi:predicted RNA-binding Zn-ribbon protein involved in translation (DUF1610 family)